MPFMLIERFKDRDAKRCIAACAIRTAAPRGLRYVGNWIEASFERCFQLMECDHARLLRQWVAFRGDPVELEIVLVLRRRRPGSDRAIALRHGTHA